MKNSEKYKVVYFVNDDNHLPVGLDPEKTLLIGNGKQPLKFSDLSLTKEQSAQIDLNTQIVFHSHGLCIDSKCIYILKDDKGEVQNYDSLAVIKQILNAVPNNAVILHMFSCHVGLVYNELAAFLQNPQDDWKGDAIFLHGGDLAIRGNRLMEVTKIISEVQLKLNNNLQNHANLFEAFYIKTPGDLSIFSISDKKVLCLNSKFVGHDLKNTAYYIEQNWLACLKQLTEFAIDIGQEIQINHNPQFDVFSYLKQSLKNGADIFYGLSFPIRIGKMGEVYKVDGDEQVEKFVDDLHALVGDKITKEQYDELIAIQYDLRSAKINCSNISYSSAEFGLNITSAHAKLFKYGFDVSKVKYGYDNHTFLERMILDNVNTPIILKTLLTIPEIKCSSLSANTIYIILYQTKNSKDFFDLLLNKISEPIDLNEIACDSAPILFDVLTHKDADELLPLLLKVAKQGIDLHAKVWGQWQLIQKLTIHDVIKKHLDILLEKSLPIDKGELISLGLLSENIGQPVQHDLEQNDLQVDLIANTD